MAGAQTVDHRNINDRPARLAWWFIAGVSGVLLVYGLSWLAVGPEFALENIAERTSLSADDFRVGSPSAFDVISLVSRQLAVFMAAAGWLMLVVAWQGSRGSRWAWVAAWTLVATTAAMGIGFVAAGGAAGPGALYLALAAMVAAALVVARRGLDPAATQPPS